MFRIFIRVMLALAFLSSSAFARYEENYANTVTVSGYGDLMLSVLNSYALLVNHPAFQSLVTAAVLVGFILLLFKLSITIQKIGILPLIVYVFLTLTLIYGFLLPKTGKELIVYDTQKEATAGVSAKIPPLAAKIVELISNIDVKISTILDEVLQVIPPAGSKGAEYADFMSDAFVKYNKGGVNAAAKSFLAFQEISLHNEQRRRMYRLAEMIEKYALHCVANIDSNFLRNATSEKDLFEKVKNIHLEASTGINHFYTEYKNDLNKDYGYDRYGTSMPFGFYRCHTVSENLQHIFDNGYLNAYTSVDYDTLQKEFEVIKKEYRLPESMTTLNLDELLSKLISKDKLDITEFRNNTIFLQLIDQSLISSAKKIGMNGYHSAVTIADYKSQMQSNWYASSLAAQDYIPILKGVLHLLLIVLTPLLVLISLATNSSKHIKIWCGMLLVLILWDPLIIIINFIMNIKIYEYIQALAQANIPISSADGLNLANNYFVNSITLTGNLLITVPMLALGIAAGSMSAFAQLSSSITSTFSSGAAMAGRAATQMASSPKTEFTGADQYDGGYTRNYDIANNNIAARSYNAFKGALTETISNVGEHGNTSWTMKNDAAALSGTENDILNAKLGNAATQEVFASAKSLTQSYGRQVVNNITHAASMQDAVNLAKQAGFSEQEIAQVQKIKQAQDTVTTETAKTLGVDESLVHSTVEGDSLNVSVKLNKGAGLALTGKFDTGKTLFGKVGEAFFGVSASLKADGSIGVNFTDDKGHKLDTKDESMQKATEQISNKLSENKQLTNSASVALSNTESLTQGISSSRAEQIAKNYSNSVGTMGSEARNYLEQKSISNSFSADGITTIANNYYKAHGNDKEATMQFLNSLSNEIAQGNLAGAMQMVQPYASDNSSLVQNDVKKVHANLDTNLDSAEKEANNSVTAEYNSKSTTRKNAEKQLGTTNKDLNSSVSSQMEDVSNAQNKQRSDMGNNEITNINGEKQKVQTQNEQLNRKGSALNEVTKDEKKKLDYNLENGGIKAVNYKQVREEIGELKDKFMN